MSDLPMYVNCPKVLDYVETHRLHKPMVIFDFQKEIHAEHEYVCMLSLDHLQTQSSKDQRSFANQFFQHYISRKWWDSYQPYLSGMLDVFQTLGLVQTTSNKTYRKSRKYMIDSERTPTFRPTRYRESSEFASKTAARLSRSPRLRQTRCCKAMGRRLYPGGKVQQQTLDRL